MGGVSELYLMYGFDTPAPDGLSLPSLSPKGLLAEDETGFAESIRLLNLSAEG